MEHIDPLHVMSHSSLGNGAREREGGKTREGDVYVFVKTGFQQRGTIGIVRRSPQINMTNRNLKLKWLLFIHLLLSDVVFGRAPLPQSYPRPSLTSVSQTKQVESRIIENDLTAAHQLVSNLSDSLQGQLDLQSNGSCAELSNGGWSGKGFSQELLGLAMVPVLVSSGCLFEAEALVMQLYEVLGQNDTHEFLQDILELIKRGKERDSAYMVHQNDFQTPSMTNSESQFHLQAVIFNINQLAEVGEKEDKGKIGSSGTCNGWVRVKDTRFLGQAAEQSKPLCLEEAQQACGSLGFQCAGVTQDGDSGYYHVILRTGSRVVPLYNSESWIQNCKVGSVRWRRNGIPQHHCVNEKEERVYTVVEWIPAVSTLYNLGTAVYYASVSCYDTAKERAIFSTVDLGTDALMAVTGGTAGVAGYALGAGLKTGVKAGIKYLLNSMKEDDDLVMNQNSWEDGTLAVQ